MRLSHGNSPEFLTRKSAKRRRSMRFHRGCACCKEGHGGGPWRPVSRTFCTRLKQRADAAGSVWVACPAGLQGAALRVRRLPTEGGASRARAEGQRAAPRKGARARGNALLSAVQLRPRESAPAARRPVQGPARASSSPRAVPDRPEPPQLACARALLLASEV